MVTTMHDSVNIMYFMCTFDFKVISRKAVNMVGEGGTVGLVTMLEDRFIWIS